MRCYASWVQASFRASFYIKIECKLDVVISCTCEIGVCLSFRANLMQSVFESKLV